MAWKPDKHGRIRMAWSAPFGGVGPPHAIQDKKINELKSAVKIANHAYGEDTHWLECLDGNSWVRIEEQTNDTE